MKKTILKCLVLMAISICLFVSCNGEQALPDEAGDVGYIRFGEDAVRGSLTAKYETESYDNLYWYYTATKNDNYGVSGQKTKETPYKTKKSNDTPTPQKGLDLSDTTTSDTTYLGPFSQGDWTFQLFAYNDLKESGTKVYESKKFDVNLLGGENKTVSVSVDPVGDNGTVKFNNAYFKYDAAQTQSGSLNQEAPYIKMVATLQGQSGTSYTFSNDSTVATTGYVLSTTKSEYTKDETNNTTATQYQLAFSATGNEVSLPKGTYKCDVTVYLKDKNNNELTGTDNATAIDSQTFYFAVYASADTIISGDLTEKVNSTVVFDVPQIVIDTTTVDEYNKTTFKPLKTVQEAEDGASDDAKAKVEEDKKLNYTTVELDLGSLNDTSGLNKDIKAVTLEKEILVGTKAAEGFNIVENSNTDSVLMSISLTAKDQNGNKIGTKEDSGLGEFGDDNKATITQYIGRGLNGEACYKADGENSCCDKCTTDNCSSCSSAGNTLNLAVYYGDEEMEGSIVAYCASTGYAKFKTSHFSTFIIVDKSKFPAYIESSGTKTYYETLEKALSAAEDNQTVVVNTDAAISSNVVLNQSITLDFDSKTVTSKNGASITVGEGKTLAVSGSAEGQGEIIKGARLNTSSSSNINGTYYPTFEAALGAAESGNTITLMENAALTGDKETKSVNDKNEAIRAKAEVANKSLTIDLNGRTLSLLGGSGILVSSSETVKDNTPVVTIKNGNVYGTNGSTFIIHQGGNLVLDNVKVYTTTPYANGIVFLYYGANPATLSVNDSVLSMDGGYGISTNATKSKETKVYISIENSTVTTTNSSQDNTALVVNVPSEVTITGSTFKGQRQAAIFRGASDASNAESKLKITSTTFEATGTENNYTDRSTAWGSGNEVPLAAVVIGNAKGNESYGAPTDITLSGVTIKTASGYKGKKIWITQADTTNTVTVTGFDESWSDSVNSNFNGATVKSLDGKTWYVADESSLTGAINNCAASGDTIKLVGDIALTSAVKIGSKDAAQKTLTINLNGKTISGTTSKQVGRTSLFDICNAKVTFDGEGTILDNGKYYGEIMVRGSSTSSASEYTVVTVNKDITCKGGQAVWVDENADNTYNGNYGVKVNFYGTADLAGLNDYAFYINGLNVKTDGNAPAFLIDGATITAGKDGEGGLGIYAAGYGEWTVKNATITGYDSAIEIRSGKLTIESGTYSSTADHFKCSANGAGTTTEGAAIAIAQHTTKLPVSVTISGGTFSGFHAMSVQNPQKTEKSSDVVATVTGGSFTATGSGAAVVNVDTTYFKLSDNPTYTETANFTVSAKEQTT